MKKWIMVVLICLLASTPVIEASATALQPHGVMVLAKKSEKKKTTKKKSTKKKKTTRTTQAASTESSNTITDDIPIDDVIMNGGSIAPDMTHLEDDEEPALVFLKTFNQFLTEYRLFMLGVAGVIDLFLIGVVIFRIIKLGSVSQSPIDRKNALTSFGISLLAVAIMGSITLWYGLFFNAFK